MIETILSGGTIVDGTGRPRYATDVGIVAHRIALVGDLSAREAVRRIDCRGTVLAPGFIDACSHTDEGWLTLATVPSKIVQGVTTEISGNCGDSRLFGGDEWTSADEFFGLVALHGIGPNGATLVGLNDAASAPDSSSAIRAACESGAIGVSIDLRKTPVDDAVRAMIAARDGGAPRACVHIRDDGDDIAAALDEAIDCAVRAGVALHVSHHRVERKTPGMMERTLERIDRARSRGLAITCDCYPYISTWIELASLLPPAISERADWQAMLEDPATAAAVAMEMQARLGSRWPDLMLSEVGSERNMAWCGMRIDEIAQQRRLSPARTVLELLRQEGLKARAFFFTLNEEDLATLLSADFAMIGSDAAGYPANAAPFGNLHPRAFGTFARVVGRFVRGRRTLTLEEAVRRMTSLPARTFGLEERGVISEGSYADLTIFDEATFVDTATYERAVSFPTGLKHVLVNGAAVVSGGTLTNERPGRMLRGGR